MTENFPCPFSLALITAANGCVNAIAITRRSGPDIACGSSEAQQRCRDAFDYIKQVTQPELGFPDNLQEAPHSVLVRLQNGGVMGLQKIVEPNARNAANIAVLMNELSGQFGAVANTPAAPILAAVRDFKITRGGSKRGR